MAKFLLNSSYTVEGLRGLSKDGGTKRAEAVRAMIENLGGRMESLSFGFDEHDTYVVCELPNHQTAAARAIAIRATGGPGRAREVPPLREARGDYDQVVETLNASDPHGK